MAANIGNLGWIDIAVPDATSLRDFYSAVVGWTATGVDMGDYQDYAMAPSGSGDPVGGVCHARGANAKLPPIWIPYFTVADIKAGTDAIVARGGTIIDGLRSMGSYGTVTFFRDPAGGVAAIIQTAGA